MALISMVFPAPVSPVSAVIPGSRTSATRSMTPRSLTTSSASTFGPAGTARRVGSGGQRVGQHGLGAAVRARRLGGPDSGQDRRPA